MKNKKLKRIEKILIRILWGVTMLITSCYLAEYFRAIQLESTVALCLSIICYMTCEISLLFGIVLCGIYSNSSKDALNLIRIIKLLIPISLLTFILLKWLF